MIAAKAWEFWPPWLFYAPVSVFVAALSVRYGVKALPAANPGLVDGGLVGESKAEILARLPAPWTIPFVLAPPGTPLTSIREQIDSRGWRYPLVAKPDVGQRGVGVRRLQSDADLVTYVEQFAGAVLIQPWHPGPYEAGVFYFRRPGETHGRIFSITDKRFPVVSGDGVSTVEELIRRHPRFRHQANVLLRRNRSERARILAKGQQLTVGEIGNHAQGALFLDGSRLITPALEARVDAIAKAIPGFFVGRFDVRYTNETRFKAGIDFAIVELNGVTAESTNIYDPSTTLLDAYRTLYAQWKLVYEIGAANLRAGTATTGVARLLSLVWAHLTDNRTFPI